MNVRHYDMDIALLEIAAITLLLGAKVEGVGVVLLILLAARSLWLILR